MQRDPPSDQPDLFSGGWFAAKPEAPPGAPEPAVAWHALGDLELIAALPKADMAGSCAIAAEMARRRLAAAIPALEHACLRFSGYGRNHVLPEQAAALDALAAIGGPEAAAAVARLILRRSVQGPGLKHAVRAAASLGSELPPERLLDLLRHDEPEVRAGACRCIGPRWKPEMVQVALDLLQDLHSEVRDAAACALGRMGQPEAREFLLGLLGSAPSAEVIDALAAVADEESMIRLNRLARGDAAFRPAVLEALDAIEHPRARSLAAALRGQPAG